MKNLQHYVYWAIDALLHKGALRKEIKKQERQLDLMGRDPLQAYEKQRQRLDEILSLVCKKIPYYKNISPQDLERFPVITKNLIRSDYWSFQNPDLNIEKMKKYHTSGSTGTPFYVAYSPSKLLANRASLLVDYMQKGYTLGDRLYYFRAWNDLNTYSKIKTLVTNFVMQDASGTSKNVDDFVAGLTNNSIILTYVSAIMSYAENISRRRLEEKVRGLVNAIIVSGETLSEEDRSYINKLFQCPVFSRYSNEENGIIAEQFDMKSSKFRVNTPCMWVEILKINDDKPACPGEIGRVVVTDLNNDAMPIIRYDTGDLSSYSIGDKINDSIFYINNIDGCKVDPIVDTRNEPLNPHYVTVAFWGTGDFISNFQLIQHSPKHVTLKYIPVDNSIFNSTLVDTKLKKIFGNDLMIDYEEVDSIPLLRSGKRCFIVNEMCRDSIIEQNNI